MPKCRCGFASGLWSFNLGADRDFDVRGEAEIGREAISCVNHTQKTAVRVASSFARPVFPSIERSIQKVSQLLNCPPGSDDLKKG